MAGKLGRTRKVAKRLNSLWRLHKTTVIFKKWKVLTESPIKSLPHARKRLEVLDPESRKFLEWIQYISDLPAFLVDLDF